MRCYRQGDHAPTSESDLLESWGWPVDLFMVDEIQAAIEHAVQAIVSSVLDERGCARLDLR